MFCSNKKNEYYLFNKKIKKERYKIIWDKLYELLNGWVPQFNNLKKLYLKYGNDWKATPINLAEEIQKKEAWEDMPKEAINYLKALTEFNVKIFEEITGIKLNKS